MTAPPTPTEDRRLLAGGAVLLVGLFLDGWAHTNVLDELESFLSPYHAVIFVGFVLTGGAVVLAVRSRQRAGAGLWEATPAAYRPALLGVLGFAVGFTGDGIWHTILGIEAGVDALLSPTHLLMAVSITAVLTAPLRSDAQRRRGGGPVPWTVVWSVTATGLVVSFFLMYAWASSNGLLLVGNGNSLVEVAGLMQTLLTTAVVAAMIAAVLRRGTPPRGGLAAPLVVVPVAQHGIVDFELSSLLLAFVAGAVAVEAATHRWSLRPAGVAVVWAFTTWTATWLVVLAVEGGTTWSPELVTGQVVIGCLAAWWVASRGDATAAPTPGRAGDDAPAVSRGHHAAEVR